MGDYYGGRWRLLVDTLHWHLENGTLPDPAEYTAKLMQFEKVWPPSFVYCAVPDILATFAECFALCVCASRVIAPTKHACPGLCGF